MIYALEQVVFSAMLVALLGALAVHGLVGNWFAIPLLRMQWNSKRISSDELRQLERALIWDHAWGCAFRRYGVLFLLVVLAWAILHGWIDWTGADSKDWIPERIQLCAFLCAASIDVVYFLCARRIEGRKIVPFAPMAGEFIALTVMWKHGFPVSYGHK